MAEGAPSFTKYVSRLFFIGSGCCSRVGSGQGDPTRRVLLEDLHTPTQPDPARPVTFRIPSEPTRLDPRELFFYLLTRPAGRVVTREKSLDILRHPSGGWRLMCFIKQVRLNCLCYKVGEDCSLQIMLFALLEKEAQVLQAT